jgi:hypothetical protein
MFIASGMNIATYHMENSSSRKQQQGFGNQGTEQKQEGK